LAKDEDPNKGLIREIKEETNLDVEIVAPVDIWFGNWRGKPLISIDYLVKIRAGELKLSEEHSEYRWISMDELEKGDPIQLDPQLGFQLDDFKKADRLINLISDRNLF
jgi:8-oxo-dGTP diphosphatase